MTQPRRRGVRIPKLTRDAGIYLLGIFILLHETLIAAGDRPTLVYAACALLGLPIVMRVDEFRHRDDEEEEEEAPPPPKPKPVRKPTPKKSTP
jgi:hypothetical protein